MKIVRLKLAVLSFLLAAFGASSVFAQQNDALTPKEIILKSFEVLGARQSWTAEMLLTNDAVGEVSKIVLRFRAPNDSHFIWTYKGKVFAETIVVGLDEFTYFEGKWVKKKKDKFDEFFDNLTKIAEASQAKFMINVGFVGKESIGGVETSVYQYDYDINAAMRDFSEKMQLKTTLPESRDEMKLKIWINSEGLPVRFESVRKAEESKGKFATLRKTTTYRFDEDVKIVAPKIGTGVVRKSR